MDEYFVRYEDGMGFAVLKRTTLGKDGLIFYAYSPIHAEEQAKVRNVWSEHQKYLRSFKSPN